MREFTITVEVDGQTVSTETVNTDHEDWNVYDRPDGAHLLAQDAYRNETDTDTDTDGVVCVYVWEGADVDTNKPATATYDNKGETWLNLTPHKVVIMPEGTHFHVTLPPSGVVARIAETASTIDGQTVVTLGDVEGLPAARQGRTLIVSMPLAMALAAKGVDRPDVVYPYGQVRDDQGRIVGCRTLARLAVG